MRRLLRSAAIVVVLLVAGLAAFVWWALRASLPVVEGRLAVSGFGKPTTVIRDRGGVPHIFADSAPDAVRALGFVQAQDRRLQMELSRLVGQGRLAEVLGEQAGPEPIVVAGIVAWGAVDFDRQARTLGLARLASEEVERLSDEERALFQAYADGVNAATEVAGAFGTVRLLGRTPEPWRPADSVLTLKLGDLSFSIQRFEELLAGALLAEVGADALPDFLPPYPDELAPVVASAALPLRVGGPLGPIASGAGSNNWVVHGSRTASGAPILANDPHTNADVALYVAHASAPGFEVIGTTLCAPVFLQGHNARIAWGVTLVGADTQDHFIERIGPDVRTRREEIRVRGRAEPVALEVRETRHGPLVRDLSREDARRLFGDEDGRYALALARAEGVPHPSPSYVGLVRAHDWATFREALRHLPTVPLNFVYADVDGHIGYQMAGRIPRREGPAPVSPVPAWEPGHEWIGEIPFDELPHAFDPPDGIIVTANQRITGPDYPYHLATRWGDVPFRARRIRALLARKPKLTLDDVAAVQLDLREEAMADVVGWARAAASDDAAVRRYQAALARWDFHVTAGSMPAALAEAFRLELVHAVFAPRLSRETFESYLWSNAGMQLVALKRIMEDDAARFFGPEPIAARAAREAAVVDAIRHATTRLEGAMGPDWDAWSWGRVHTVSFLPPLARGFPPRIARFFEVGPFPVSGSSFTVNAGWWAAARPFGLCRCTARSSIWATSRARAWSPPPPGQQEQPLSAHYADLAEPWLVAQYRAMPWTRAQVEREAESALVLEPPAP